MPFRDIRDLQVREVLTAAFDMAKARLGVASDDPVTGRLALLIMAHGETATALSAESICEGALAELGRR